MDINLALDTALGIIFKVGGKWQFDDTTHPKYPIITTALVSSQRDYSFTEDEQGNLILEIQSVMCRVSASGLYAKLEPVDQQSDEDMESFYSGANTTGVPTRYDKTANGIFLDCIPSYSSSDGLMIFISREGSYFSVTDTTKKAGISGLFHEYLALRPSHFYCKRNKMFKLADEYKKDMIEMESAMKKHYRDRSKDETSQITGECINSI